ncbi:hypothetical protein BASA83_009169, partial [Batrachochytrium salamandrivorans]
MLRTLSTGKVFTTLDLRGAYNLLRIKEGDEPKTSFITKYGQFEFLVMPFGLANAPAQFQRMMNALFRDVVGKHVLVYLDDIVIYSDTMDKHVKQVQSVLGVCETTVSTVRLRNATFTRLKSSTLDYAISGVLSQYDDTDVLRPIAFYARQMNSAERNYEIYDKELLAVVDSFKHWRHFLQGGHHPVTVLCDHKNLDVVLQKVFVLESDWPLIIADFLAGEDNVWMDDIPDDVMDRCKKELKNFRFRDNSFLLGSWKTASPAAYVSTDKRVDIMNHYHTSLAHLKYGSIIDLLNRRFWWPTMKKDLKDYIARCPECQLDQSASGVHSPLPIRPVPQSHFHLNVGELTFMAHGRD